MSSATSTFIPADSRPSPSGYFAHHGVWAPGVRVFRRMSFAGKSSLIAMAFLVPVIVLAALFVPEKVATVQKTMLERTSLGYANDAIELLRRAQEFRRQALRGATQQPDGESNTGRQLRVSLQQLDGLDADPDWLASSGSGSG